MNALFPASYSRLSCYEKCPAQSQYRYIEGLRTPSSAASSRGTMIHEGIENFLTKKTNMLPPEAQSINVVAHIVREKDAVIEHRIAFDRHFKKVVPWKDPTAWFRMVLDAAYLEDRIAQIQEWKSGKVWEDHKDQRRLYAIGAMGEWDVDYASVTTYYTDQRSKLSILVDRGQCTMLVGQFNIRLEKMENEKHFAPRPGRYCRWCDFSRYKGGPCRVG
jgi:CRISPR/Cas system-associated exonuclease Cas4 (RecB family)